MADTAVQNDRTSEASAERSPGDRVATTPSGRSLFSESDRQRINAAVAEAESKTAAEIVPVIARSSGRYDRAEDMAGLVLAMLGLTVAWILFQGYDANVGGWDGPRLGLGLLGIMVTILVCFFLGAFAAANIDWLRRIFVLKGEMNAEVEARARQAFFDQRIHHAPGRTGVLIYVSLFERMAVILADDLVIEKLGMPAIEDLCLQLRLKLKGESVPAAMEQAIRAAGDKLAAVLPRTDGDVNELPDALIIV